MERRMSTSAKVLIMLPLKAWENKGKCFDNTKHLRYCAQQKQFGCVSKKPFTFNHRTTCVEPVMKTCPYNAFLPSSWRNSYDSCKDKTTVI